MEDLEVASRLEFHGVAYVATVSVAQQQLHVQVEVDDHSPLPVSSTTQASSPSLRAHPPSPRPSAAHEWTCWIGSFPSAYIEELTRKTGNFKRFPIFVNMLLSAISQRSDAVFIDLLTTSDLELYRKRKMGGRAAFPHKSSDAFDSFPSASTASTANKRYLILTYAVEFDRVHYPLPLSLVQTPTPEILQRTIRRLRQALASPQGDSKAQQLHEELELLKEENRCLKNTLKQQFGSATENVDYSNRQQIDGSESPIDLQRELQATLKENKELIGIYQQLREESTSEISKLKAEIRHLQVSQTNVRASSSHHVEAGGDAVRMLQKQMEQERSEARRKMNDSSNMVEETLEQLQQMKAQFDETQLKNRELMRQLAIARAKVNDLNQTTGSSTYAKTLQATRAVRATMSSSNGPQSSSNAPSRLAMRQRSALPIHFRQSHPYEDSDEEDSGHTTDGDGASGRRRQLQRPFRRFDPTAYQQEKQRKLRMGRSQSPHNSTGATNRRPRRGSNAGGGYTSDSSAGGGGYSSAGSNDSNRRGRPRTRASAEHQRAVADRLASPKRVQDPDTFTNSAPRFRAPLSRPAVRANSRGRSPSPVATANNTTQRNNSERAAAPPPPLSSKVLPPTHPRFGQHQQHRQALPPPPPPAQTKRPSATARKKTLQQRAAAGKASAASALLADTTADSFSDIDDRLNALQQFLKEAKQGGTVATNQAQV